jgi:hypothetical protein
MQSRLIKIGACAMFISASPVAFAQSPDTGASRNGTTQSESVGGENRNGATQSGDKKADVQGQTDPKRNGTSQSESVGGENKNGQPQ